MRINDTLMVGDLTGDVLIGEVLVGDDAVGDYRKGGNLPSNKPRALVSPIDGISVTAETSYRA